MILSSSSFDIVKKLLFLFNLKQSNLDQYFFAFCLYVGEIVLVEKAKAFWCPICLVQVFILKTRQHFIKYYSSQKLFFIKI
jgi:hypothetical protein